MRRLLLIAGIVSIVICVFALLFALLNLYGYYHVLDGSSSLYNRLHQRMIIYFVVGFSFALIGTVCFIIRSKIF